MNFEWLIWRPVLAKVATYSEIMTYWNMSDLADCHEALDVQEEMKAKAHADAKRRKG